MQPRLTRIMMIAAVAVLYALIALPLPYLLIDHYSAMQAEDSGHSDVDVHAWLEWAAGSSLSGTAPALPSVPVPSLSPPFPSAQVFPILLSSTLHSRGPPSAA